MSIIYYVLVRDLVESKLSIINSCAKVDSVFTFNLNCYSYVNYG